MRATAAAGKSALSPSPSMVNDRVGGVLEEHGEGLPPLGSGLQGVDPGDDGVGEALRVAVVADLHGPATRVQGNGDGVGQRLLHRLSDELANPLLPPFPPAPPAVGVRVRGIDEGAVDTQLLLEMLSGVREGRIDEGDADHGDFGDAITNHRKPFCAGEEGYAALKLVLSVYQSAREDRKITL